MKTILLPVLLCGAALLTGCETVAVVDHSPYYRPGVVYYDSGRPYYYTSGVRYWGYPYGYSGYRGYNGYHNSYTHVDVDRDVTRNYYVDRRTVYRNGNATRHPHASAATHVKAQPRQVVVTKKKKVHDHDERD